MVLDRLRIANLMVKLEKCEFTRFMLKALRHIVDKQGISSDPEKIRAIREFPRPPAEGSNSKKLRALRAFLGFLSYYRRFINGFTMLAKPLHDLVGAKGPLSWGEDAEKSFQALKKALEGANRLASQKIQSRSRSIPMLATTGLGWHWFRKIGKGKDLLLSLVDC